MGFGVCVCFFIGVDSGGDGCEVEGKVVEGCEYCG